MADTDTDNASSGSLIVTTLLVTSQPPSLETVTVYVPAGKLFITLYRSFVGPTVVPLLQLYVNRPTALAFVISALIEPSGVPPLHLTSWLDRLTVGSLITTTFDAVPVHPEASYTET